MGLLRIYTAVSQEGQLNEGEGGALGPGAYGCVLRYTNREGETFRRELAQGFARTSANRLALFAAIRSLEALNRPCRAQLWSPSNYLTDAFNKGWIEKWRVNNWQRETSGHVRNVDLWETLLQAAEGHALTWTRYRSAALDEDVLQKDAVSGTAYQAGGVSVALPEFGARDALIGGPETLAELKRRQASERLEEDGDMALTLAELKRAQVLAEAVLGAELETDEGVGDVQTDSE